MNNKEDNKEVLIPNKLLKMCENHTAIYRDWWACEGDGRSDRQRRIELAGRYGYSDGAIRDIVLKMTIEFGKPSK